MEPLRAPYLVYPVAFVVGLFLVDKLFLLPEVRDNFIQPGGMLYYALRKQQIAEFPKEMAALAPGQHSAVVFGDSRSFALGDLPAKYVKGPRWDVFNFAGPQAVPGYHAFLAERLFRGLKRPDYLMLGISPDAFNRNAGVFAVPVLAYGVDAEWIENNRTHIPARDYEAYQSTRRFALAGLQFSANELLRRLRGSQGGGGGMTPAQLAVVAGIMQDSRGLDRKIGPLVALLRGAANPNLSQYSLSRSPQAAILRMGRGAQYAWFGTATDAALREDTERLVSLYLQSFAYSAEQMYFYTRTLELARRAGVRVLVFQPRVNPYMVEAYRREPLIGGITKEIARVARQNGADFVDLNETPEVDCREFYDASHMSVSCFPAITRYLLSRLERR